VCYINNMNEKRYGNVQKYCYDIADAVVVARAGHYLLQERYEDL